MSEPKGTSTRPFWVRDILEKIDALALTCQNIAQEQAVMRQSTLGLLIEEVKALGVGLDGHLKHEDFASGMIAKKLEALAESQGKLLAAVSDAVAACKANGDGISFVRGEIGKLDSQLTTDFTQLYNGHSLCLRKLSQLFDAWNALARPTKQKNCASKKSRKVRGRKKKS